MNSGQFLVGVDETKTRIIFSNGNSVQTMVQSLENNW